MGNRKIAANKKPNKVAANSRFRATFNAAKTPANAGVFPFFGPGKSFRKTILAVTYLE
jgi:hypothetical protein